MANGKLSIKVNRWGCKPLRAESMCLVHDEHLVCNHGCIMVHQHICNSHVSGARHKWHGIDPNPVRNVFPRAFEVQDSDGHLYRFEYDPESDNQVRIILDAHGIGWVTNIDASCDVVLPAEIEHVARKFLFVMNPRISPCRISQAITDSLARHMEAMLLHDPSGSE